MSEYLFQKFIKSSYSKHSLQNPPTTQKDCKLYTELTCQWLWALEKPHWQNCKRGTNLGNKEIPANLAKCAGYPLFSIGFTAHLLHCLRCIVSYLLVWYVYYHKVLLSRFQLHTALKGLLFHKHKKCHIFINISLAYLFSFETLSSSLLFFISELACSSNSLNSHHGDGHLCLILVIKNWSS